MREGNIVEYGGDMFLTPQQRHLLKGSWLAKEEKDYARCDDLRGRAIKAGGIRKVKYGKDGQIWVLMGFDPTKIPEPTYVETMEERAQKNEEIRARLSHDFAERYRECRE